MSEAPPLEMPVELFKKEMPPCPMLQLDSDEATMIRYMIENVGWKGTESATVLVGLRKKLQLIEQYQAAMANGGKTDGAKRLDTDVHRRKDQDPGAAGRGADPNVR